MESTLWGCSTTWGRSPSPAPFSPGPLLARRGIQIQPERDNYKREDNPGWKKEYYRLWFRLINLKKNHEILLDKAELKILMGEINKASWLNRVFKQGKYGRFLF